MSFFYVVGTPIGNLGDITLRALDVLKNADVIICEDTRVTMNLLNRYGINKPTLSYHARSGTSKTNDIFGLVESGKNLALVSDAGTPGISDPGAELISKLREKFVDKIGVGELKIEAVPGPSALTASLSIAGMPCSDFLFLGFLPHKKGRETLFEEIKETRRTVVFYESPHRIMKTLNSLGLKLEGSDKKIAICREITKIYEQVVTGSIMEVREYFEKNKDKIRGEFVVIVG